MITKDPPFKSENFDKLFIAAKQVRLKAYVPYSKFQ